MNRRSFLLGIATFPVAKAAVARDDVIIGVDGCGPGRCGVVVVPRKYGMPIGFRHDEIHVLESMSWRPDEICNVFRVRPDGFIKIETRTSCKISLPPHRSATFITREEI